MADYQPTIGLEIHAELKTRTKMFCDSLNDPEEARPNVNVCPVCLGHPGTLPVPNRQAIEHVVRVGLALGSSVSAATKFDRKNYFYPDLPKAYQISQYDKPLVHGGTLLGVRIRRVHLEEDTGTLVHADGASLVDYNRAGVPLMELVTEPDFTSAEQVTDFARELQLMLRYLGVSDANMEKGEMRIEANVSLNMGTKVELKNINSFKAVHDAVTYELKRQAEALEAGEKLRQETRGWDEAKQKTVAQRSKEEAHDYRYFPDPDLPPFETAVFEPERLRAGLPELPAAKRERFAREYGFDPKQADWLVIEKDFANFFEDAVSEYDAWWKEVPDIEKVKRFKTQNADEQKNERILETTLIYNFLTSDLKGMLNVAGQTLPHSKITPEKLAHLIIFLRIGKITSRQAKDMLATMFATGDDPETIMARENIGIVSDEGEIERVVLDVIAANPAAVADYRKGKTASLQFLIGKSMGILKGKARPDTLKQIFERNLA